MKRPTIYSKPLAGDRKENYHPADTYQNQYAEDLNKYIDYLEGKIKNVPAVPSPAIKKTNTGEQMKKFHKWKNEEFTWLDSDAQRLMQRAWFASLRANK